MHEIIYTKKADQDLEKLAKVTAKRIVNKIYHYSITTDPLIFAKKLQNSSVITYRFRVGDYRAIFDLDDKNKIKILLILRIKHRKEAYRGFKAINITLSKNPIQPS